MLAVCLCGRWRANVLGDDLVVSLRSVVGVAAPPAFTTPTQVAFCVALAALDSHGTGIPGIVDAGANAPRE